MKKWIAAARLRTLPLSISGIILGSLVAKSEGHWNILIFVLALITTASLQILSNYANDYGDGIKGTDEKRLGEKRAVASGIISAQQMKNVVILFSFLSALFAFLLIFVAFREKFLWVLLFCVMALACIWAAIKYTVGKNAYGYAGLGDVFVFIFFGIVSVWGSYTLFQHDYFSWNIFFNASSIGLLSCGVLNLNNMRDMQTDKLTGKNTIPLRIGLKNAKIYQSLLLVLPFILSTIFILNLSEIKTHYFLFWILIIPAILFLKKMFSVTDARELDGELKKVSLLTLAFSLILGISLNF